MARADYIKCEVCDGKTLYDGDRSIRDREDIIFSALCLECSKTYTLRARPKSLNSDRYAEVDMTNAVWKEREECASIARKWASDVRNGGTARIVSSKICAEILAR